MIRIYTGPQGFAFSLFFIAGLLLFISILFFGMAAVIRLFLPLLIVLAYLLIAVFVTGILPSTFVKGLRPRLAALSMMMSHTLGAFTWMVSFFYVIRAFGFFGVLLAFLFQWLAPVALAAAALKGSWHIAGHLAAWIAFGYLMRLYGQRLAGGDTPLRPKAEVIDVEAVPRE